jgi:hypothetical protein
MITYSSSTMDSTMSYEEFGDYLRLERFRSTMPLLVRKVDSRRLTLLIKILVSPRLALPGSKGRSSTV